MTPRAGSRAFASKRAELAACIRHGAEPERIAAVRAQLADAERDQRTDVLVEHVRRIVAQAPPLTDEQRDRIAAALRPAVEHTA